MSFASKLVHWFVAPQAVPIYDAWAVEGLKYHFGRMRWAGRSTYRAYAEYVFRLRDSCDAACSLRHLDRYLWLSGMYRAWIAAADRSKVGLSGEVRGLFERDDPDVQDSLRGLLGEQ